MARLAVLIFLLMSACATLPRFEAASDIHALLVAIRDGDRSAFDAHVDRAALKEQLRARVLSEAGSSSALAALGALLARPLVDVAVDQLVRPDVFRAVAVELGYASDKPLPGSITISQFVRPLEGGRACVFTRRGGPCVLLFRQEDGVYKLVGFEGRFNFSGGRLKLSS